MKIRTKWTLTFFLLSVTLVSLFSIVLFVQVRDRTLSHIEADRLHHMQHDFGHGEHHAMAVSNDLEQAHHYLRLLGGFLALGVVLVSGLMVPGSWLIANWCLRPFKNLAEQTGALDAKALAFRFPEPAQTQDEYVRLVAAFNQLLARLDRSFGELNLFAAKASHELKTPLASIIAQTEKALRQPALPEEARASLQKILSQATRLSRVTQQLLQLADVDSKRGQVQAVSTDGARVVREVADSFGAQAKATHKSISIHTEGPMALPAGADILAISVGNLVENALKFGRTHVAISLKRNGGAAEIRVEDDGPGLAPAQSAVVTAPFTRDLELGDGSKNPGSGLGLAIVKAAVESVKGQLSFAKSEQGGLMALISIPLNA